jgi:UDP-N-acetylglucosamine--N-acetylmuramyl-(pentapeptide) pyrophosphoryl-undecaprenol N-acetylglucosamine transferase
LNSSNKNIIIAGGGTGGHIFPAVAIAHAWKNKHASADILFVGALGKMEMEKVPKEGYKIIGLPIAGFNRSSMLKNLSLPYKMIKSYFLARKILKENKPAAVVGVGGFASLPMLYVAQQFGIPTLIQEQNGFAGKANKTLAKKAQAICVAYDGMEQFFPAHKITLTGNPVRKAIAQSNIDKQAALAKFALAENKKTILIIGGSLGAKSINDVLVAQHQIILDAGYQILWQTGKPSYANAIESTKGKQNIQVHEFIYDMQFAYAAADIVISRSGALSIAELCISGKPVVFVPYPFAAEDHQTTNAMKLVHKHAALCVADAKVQAELIPAVLKLAEDKALCNSMAANIKALAIIDADERIINQLEKIISTS